jgi:hypothetical protein
LNPLAAGLPVTRRLRPSASVEPPGDLAGVEADEPPDLHDRDSMFGDEPANVAGGDAEPFGELFDGQ